MGRLTCRVGFSLLLRVLSSKFQEDVARFFEQLRLLGRDENVNSRRLARRGFDLGQDSAAGQVTQACFPGGAKLRRDHPRDAAQIGKLLAAGELLVLRQKLEVTLNSRVGQAIDEQLGMRQLETDQRVRLVRPGRFFFVISQNGDGRSEEEASRYAREQ